MIKLQCDILIKILLAISLLLFRPGLSLAQDTITPDKIITMFVDHADGGKLSKRHMQKLLDALSDAECHVAITDKLTSSVQLVFDPRPVSLVIKQRPDYRLIARAKTTDNAFHVRGAIVVQASRGIKNLSSLKNEWISFVSKDSWSGYHLPLKLLNDAGIDEHSNSFYFVGNHIGVVGALLHRDTQVAVTVEPLAKHWAEQNNLAIVAVTDEVETGGWWLHRNVSDITMQNCVRAVTGLDGNRYKTLPAWIGGFVVPD
ncbi:MAG: phosphate/phosphite/phosphonate ABC transporter substrate-binding protein [Gammaproteobacteria bacterium]|nr:phosphate/phosphite/phosphonate ABC transporter substrate-binding protein [Gammaproteobacteria bacterium]